MKRIVFIHFLNNFSGSPNVLSLIVREFIKRGYKVDLLTSRGDGFLSDIKSVNYKYTCYRWCKSKFLTAFLLLCSQLYVFFRILLYSKNNTIFYINTITPIGAAWACKLTGKARVYHVHEDMQQDKPLYGLYRLTYKYCNIKTIFVSQYLEKLAIGTKQGKVIYNSLAKEFSTAARQFLQMNSTRGNNILMVSSLRRFKGVYEFVELARRLPNYTFEIVLSANEQDVETFKIETLSPNNIIIHALQQNLHPFYQRAKLLLQLSHPDSWIETFGLTILEAMAYGIPSIVPNVGGPVELVENGQNGFTVDTHNLDKIAELINLLMLDPILYETFSKVAIEKSRKFELNKMINIIEEYI